MPCLLAIDLGTTTCRCAIFDLDGRQVAAAYRETPVRYPRPVWAESDPEAWWASAVAVVREAVAAAGLRGDQVSAIGVAGLMHAPVLVDGAGRPVAPAVLWMDQRCAPECDALRQAYEAMPGARRDVRFSPTVSAPKLRWLADHQPEVLARAQRFLLPKDFLRYRLTGVAATDPSDAGGTGMFDRQAGDWDWEIVHLARLPRALLPPIVPSSALAGRVTPQAAAETGLAAGTPVAAGGGDAYCTRLGAGVPRAGEVCLYLGTAAWISFGAGAASAAPGVVRVPGVAGATTATGAALRWARDLLSGDAAAPPERGPAAGAASYEALTAAAAQVPPGAEGVFFLPHLMGERGPHADPWARGALVGLTLRHGPAHVVRAVLEGTAFQIRRVLDARAAQHRQADASGQPPAPTGGIACGGGARSPLWLQILADVTTLPLRTPREVEAGALGAAMLGGAAAGLVSVAEAQARLAGPGAVFSPDTARVAQYDALYRRYGRLDDLLAPWFQETAEETAGDDAGVL